MRFGYHERQQAYKTMQRLLDRFMRDDFDLARMAELARADGFSCGGGGEGGSRAKGDHSDPTGVAAAQRWDLGSSSPRQPDPATVAFDAFKVALGKLGEADIARRRALPPVAGEEPPLADDEKPKVTVAVDTWCLSCARVKRGREQLIFNPRSSRSGGRRDLCTWCQDEWLGSGVPGARRDPDERLVMLHEYLSHTGGHMTVARRAEALAMSVKDARKRYLGIHERTAAVGAFDVAVQIPMPKTPIAKGERHEAQGQQRV